MAYICYNFDDLKPVPIEFVGKKYADEEIKSYLQESVVTYLQKILPEK